MSVIAFIDTEVDPSSGKVLDIGGVRSDGGSYRGKDSDGLKNLLSGVDYICGHNILNHDMKYIREAIIDSGHSEDTVIDTLFVSPLLFPKKPYHKLLKDDKLQTDELNNPLSDAKKSQNLFSDECAAFRGLDKDIQYIYTGLLSGIREFRAFFKYVNPGHREIPAGRLQRLFRESPEKELSVRIAKKFNGSICSHADIEGLVKESPAELAYSLALISCLDEDGTNKSTTPPWVLHNYPGVQRIMFLLRMNPCIQGCSYCNRAFDIHQGLKRWFGFNSFRMYDGEPLQEKAVEAAVSNRSLLAIFPTGGGKSLAFQLPALMAGEAAAGLTVVISPLQSLMKDQVDNLERRGITAAVTINGLLDPIERAKSFERVEDGSASILYISPESLRSRSIERILLKRKIARFVVDEAHCFSSWGQDFRVDYLYIADFIKSLQEKKNLPDGIPVSCFTATAKPQVIDDIRNYFKDNLGVELSLFSASVSRHNLHYAVLPEPDDKAKYAELRGLI